MDNRRQQPTIRGDINFTVGGVSISLAPLQRRDAGRVFHTVLTRVLAPFAGAVVEDKTRAAAEIGAALRGVAFDDIEELLGVLTRGALVDNKPTEGIDDAAFDFLAENPHLMYVIIFHGVKGNWPRLFFELLAKLDAFAPGAAEKIKEVAPGA